MKNLNFISLSGKLLVCAACLFMLYATTARAQERYLQDGDSLQIIQKDTAQQTPLMAPPAVIITPTPYTSDIPGNGGGAAFEFIFEPLSSTIYDLYNIGAISVSSPTRGTFNTEIISSNFLGIIFPANSGCSYISDYVNVKLGGYPIIRIDYNQLVNANLTAGVISGPVATLSGGSASLTQSGAATLGTCSSIIKYQWQQSTNGTSFTDINGATGTSYTSAALTQKRWFRRQAYYGTKKTVGNTVYSNVIAVTAVNPGSINGGQIISKEGQSVTLSSSATASGHDGYQWESSANNTSWTAITGATGASYTSPQLSARTYYRRVAYVGSYSTYKAYSNAADVYVLKAGSISGNQTVKHNTAPTALQSTASGYGQSGYRWEYSVNNSTWTAITGATGTTCQPGKLTVNTYYRRVAYYNNVNVYSNTVTVKVLAAGQISGDQTIMAGSAPARLQSKTNAANQDGYRWQYSADNITWNTITGATENTYQPASLLVTAYFRRVAYSGNLEEMSNTVLVTVKNGPDDLSYFPNNHNYIICLSPIKAVQQLNELTKTEQQRAAFITYYDGLGRPEQTIDIGASPDGKDIVTPIEYDNFGREVHQYLPYEAASNNGSYKPNASGDVNTNGSQRKWYASAHTGVPADARPFAETTFEPSPLNRITEQFDPGNEWKTNNKRQVFAYKTNTAGEVRLWTATDSQVSSSGNYPANSLHVTETADEDGRKHTEYVDLQGRTVRRQQWVSVTEYAITDFVYDDFGRLRYVLPPAIVKTANKTIAVSTATSYNHTTEFAQYVYAYKYDERGRVIEKHIPGAGWTYIVYNKLDMPVLTQDAQQRVSNEWTYSKYDAFGREVITGLFKPGSNIYSTIRANVYNASKQWEERNSAKTDYTSNAYPVSTSQCTALAVNFYDEYGFTAKAALQHNGHSTRTRGLQTGSKIREVDGTAEYFTVIYYNEKGRIICTASDQPNSKWDKTVHTYDFIGRLLSSARNHNGNFTLTTKNKYDHAGRLKTVKQHIAGDTVIVAQNDYNALGQLIQTTLHEGLETIEYDYNIRGWLTKISSDHFREKLYYQDVVNSIGNNKQWSGNISAAAWKAKSKDEYWHAYKYGYDKLNRLEKGEYTRSNGTSDTNITYGTNAGQYNENYEYDIMGNFELINRYHGNASSAIDQLAFFYTGTGNRVSQISDASGNSTGFSGTSTYGYDAAGRMTSDSQKGTIAYNHLGLVKTVTKNSDVLTYTYDATGRRLKKQLGTNTARYYIDGVEYEGANLQFVHTPYGRIRKSGSDWFFDYFLKDHLGNVRVVLEAGSASTSSSGNSVTYLATMEESRAAEENQYFANVDATRADKPYNYSSANPLNAKVSKVQGKSEGLKITLKVMAGDTIEISAQAFYNIDNDFPGKSVNIAPVIGAAVAALTNPVGAVIGEAKTITDNMSAAASQSTMLSNLSEENLQNNLAQPKSGINFVLYNSRFDVVEENTGYLPVENHINAVQILATDKLVMKEAGFIEIFVNNQAQTPVYYDNMMVTHSGGNVVEVNAYYPYGMIIPNLSEEATYGANAYKWSAKELQKELELNWYDHGARMYDPRGRTGWWVPDPLAEKYYHISPYAYCGNDPINYIDPDGRDRKLVYNQSNNTIIVKATYYHGQNSTLSAMAGVKVFNEMKGMTYTDKDGKTWNVKFDLTTKKVDNPGIVAAQDPKGNSFAAVKTVINPETKEEAAGITRNQKNIEVGEKYVNKLTPAHEIGHTLGMANKVDGKDNHSKTGIMTPSGSDPNRNGSLEQVNINQMIEQGTGPVEQYKSLWERFKDLF